MLSHHHCWCHCCLLLGPRWNYSKILVPHLRFPWSEFLNSWNTHCLLCNWHWNHSFGVELSGMWKVGTEGWQRDWVQELGWAPVLSSAKRVVRYSLGSMALGSLLVAIIEMIRFVLEFIRKRLKLLESAPGGCCLSILFCCAQCCLGCIEWTIKFINRNAYIVVPFIHPALGLGCERFTSYEQTIWKSQKKQDRYKSI